MLKLDITPIHLFGATCYEDTIITVANWWDLEYLLGFMESWRFEYRRREDEADEKLGDRIRYSTTYEVNRFRDSVGIEVKALRYAHFDEAIAKIKEEIADRKPVAIYIDGFWAPWDHIYQKEHFLYHACIAIGFDESNDNLICIDPFHGIFHELELPLDHYRKGFGSTLLVFSRSLSSDAASQSNWRDSLSRTIATLRGEGQSPSQSSFKALESFADDIENDMDLTKEFDDINSIWKSSLYLSIETAIMGRVKFLNVIHHLAVKHNDEELHAFHDRFEVGINKWQVFKNKLLKSYMTKNTGANASLAKLVREQAKLERQLAEELEDIVSGSTASVRDPSLGCEDLALSAVVTASSSEVRYPASNINDGLFYTEWRAEGETNSAWVKLEWESARTVNRIVIRDSPNQYMNLNGGRLIFSSGYSVEAEGIPTDGTPKDVRFPAQKATWVMFHTTGCAGSSDREAGIEGLGVSACINQIKAFYDVPQTGGNSV
ncbi:DUF7402 domain-containing protein [Cohnella cholangitidis]|uniref:DUF7402 domain-containing protein n=1 Tax=Cohnella cholangitidis TaxID=2598458 RepID=UPI0015F98BD4|nr:BtrH N-terminal domain-containing protein [Cohnella cholangitidis]